MKHPTYPDPNRGPSNLHTITLLLFHSCLYSKPYVPFRHEQQFPTMVLPGSSDKYRVHWTKAEHDHDIATYGVALDTRRKDRQAFYKEIAIECGPFTLSSSSSVPHRSKPF